MKGEASRKGLVVPRDRVRLTESTVVFRWDVSRLCCYKQLKISIPPCQSSRFPRAAAHIRENLPFYLGRRQ
jgi:hypothetical protein